MLLRSPSFEATSFVDIVPAGSDLPKFEPETGCFGNSAL